MDDARRARRSQRYLFSLDPRVGGSAGRLGRVGGECEAGGGEARPLVLGLIQVESGFRKYALSSAGARGYMQVMPFWVRLIGEPHHNLFSLRTNLRYGCVILRHYLDVENGDLYRALGRYNGSLGRPEYPNLVLAAWKGTEAALLFSTGSTPGMPMQTGQVRVFASSPNAVSQPQKILVLVWS